MTGLPKPGRLAATVLVATSALAVASPALAATQLPTPGTPAALDVTTTSITISWSPSAGPVAGYTIQLITGRQPWSFLDTTAATSYTHTGLAPDTIYEYRVIANPEPSSDQIASAPSGYIAVRTEPLPDSVPPTAPDLLFTTGVSTIAATVHVRGSTDNNRIAGYVMQRQVGGVWTDWATNTIATVYLRDLAPGTTYTVVAVAFDANGNRSPQSPPVTFTTRQLEPAPTCRANMIVFGQQYLVTVLIENMTADTVIEDWTVTFTLPAAHAVGNSFSASLARDGDLATATPASWFTTIGPGGSPYFGFGASYPAGSPLPSSFALHSSATGTIACPVELNP